MAATDNAENVFVSLVGSTLINNKKEEFKASDLANNKVIGLYFSAHWCGPCKMFTPLLVRTYNSLKAAGKEFEIVFISNDRSAKEFEGYFSTMPWLSMPYDSEEREELEAKLSRKYQVEGIPTLVLLNEKGKTLTKDGREVIANDPDGAQFPWTPKPVMEIIGDKFVDNQGQNYSLDHLKEQDAIGFYFSAHWCPPCKIFTPQLATTYNKLKKEGKKIEIVFLSSDRDESQFKEYFHEMPWLAVPYNLRQVKANLSRHYGVQGIPTFVIVDPKTGKTINPDGREAVSADPEGQQFPWVIKPLDALNPIKGSDKINSAPCAIIMLDKLKDQAAIDQSIESIRKVASSYWNNWKATAKKPEDEDGEETYPLYFFYATASDNPLVDRLRTVFELPGESNQVSFLITDIPEARKYMEPKANASNADLEARFKSFVASFLDKSLKPIDLQ